MTWWPFKKKRGRIETEIARSSKDRTRMTVRSHGKVAVTEYEVLEEFGFLTLLKLKLKTGRTHQIRVHLSFIGHPVFGDLTYGGRNRQLGRLTNIAQNRSRPREIRAQLLQPAPRHANHFAVPFHHHGYHS